MLGPGDPFDSYSRSLKVKFKISNCGQRALSCYIIWCPDPGFSAALWVDVFGLSGRTSDILQDIDHISKIMLPSIQYKSSTEYELRVQYALKFFRQLACQKESIATNMHDEELCLGWSYQTWAELFEKVRSTIWSKFKPKKSSRSSTEASRKRGSGRCGNLRSCPSGRVKLTSNIPKNFQKHSRSIPEQRKFLNPKISTSESETDEHSMGSVSFCGDKRKPCLVGVLENLVLSKRFCHQRNLMAMMGVP